MKKKIDWLNHSLEFFVVIIGILIAFQLDKCSENRKLEENLAEHRTFLLEETKSNQYSLRYAQKAVASSIETLDSMTMLIKNGAESEILKQMALKLFDDSGYFYIRKNAYTTLTESGDIRFLDFEEKKRIVSLYGYYDWTESVQLRSFEGANEYYEYLKSNADLYNSQAPSRKIFENKLFNNILGSYRYALVAKQEKYKDCAEVITKFLENQEPNP
ncbi:hypothetical protein [Croceivirga thetidis]|uniref:Uncharacterized protein n=1 Tax=Croceivirga thetidis TaxID=2721623 RepID=A0ABX1GVS1_9FLAO|nr:hypothetical protein [Croceivirga thetidis]NKI33131.1 hypothetical protein [Croceivirga thetidis]